MKAKHTQGSWDLFADKNSRTIAIHCNNNARNPVVHWGGFDDNGDQKWPEKLANATLIAGAPEILEALINLVDKILYEDIEVKVPEIYDFVKDAELAISKAEGKIK